MDSQKTRVGRAEYCNQNQIKYCRNTGKEYWKTMAYPHFPRPGVITLACALVLPGCVGRIPPANPAATAIAVPVHASQPQSFTEFNERIAEAVRLGETWPREPVLVVRNFTSWGAERVGALLWHGTGEQPGRYHFVAINDNLLDDSVRGHRLEVTVERQPDNSWRIVDARMSWRCWRKNESDFFGVDRCP